MPAKQYSPPALEFKTEDQKDTTQKVVNGVLVVGGVLLAGAAAIFAWQFFLETVSVLTPCIALCQGQGAAGREGYTTE